MGLAGVLTTSRARRAAIGVISPMIAFTSARRGEIPAACWRHPYMIGFLSMLISIIAKQWTSNRISSENLGIVQGDTWQAITGLPDDRIGEDICLLSVEGDRDFLGGCANAARFADAWRGCHDPGDWDIGQILDGGLERDAEAISQETLDVFGRGGAVAAALWIRYFEDHLS